MTSNAHAERTGASDLGLRAPLDIADAIDLLAAAGNDRSRHTAVLRAASPVGSAPNQYAFDGQPSGIVGHALSKAQVAVADLESMRDHCLRELYREGRLPIQITLGALIVLDAAQRSQDRGRPTEDVLDDATAAAARFLDLVAVLPALSRHGHPVQSLADAKPRVHPAPCPPREPPCTSTPTS